MGNYISCRSSCACLEGPSGGARAGGWVAESRRSKVQRCKILVVHWEEGRVVEVGGGAPMKVAEIMLDFPGQFVCQCDMKYATPLPADHEALPGSVYILFPLHKLHTRLSPRQRSSYINLLHTKVSSYPSASHCKPNHSSKHVGGGSKVTPLCNVMQPPPPLHLRPSDEEMDSFLVQVGSSQRPTATAITLQRSKSWIPRLQAIQES